LFEFHKLFVGKGYTRTLATIFWSHFRQQVIGFFFGFVVRCTIIAVIIIIFIVATAITFSFITVQYFIFIVGIVVRPVGAVIGPNKIIYGFFSIIILIIGSVLIVDIFGHTITKGPSLRRTMNASIQ